MGQRAVQLRVNLALLGSDCEPGAHPQQRLVSDSTGLSSSWLLWQNTLPPRVPSLGPLLPKACICPPGEPGVIKETQPICIRPPQNAVLPGASRAAPCTSQVSDQRLTGEKVAPKDAFHVCTWSYVILCPLTKDVNLLQSLGL